jgi:hypothetical protein
LKEDGTMVKSALALTCLVAATTVTPALALESKGQTTVTWGGKTSLHRFVTTVDPETHSFVRSGEIELASGRKASYRIEASCPDMMTCKWTGTAKGPLGGEWTGSGTLTRPAPDRALMTGKVIAPTGQAIEISRDVDGDLVGAIAALKLK